MTVLWRKRQMILGLTGGRWPACGPPSFPRWTSASTPMPQNSYSRGLSLRREPAFHQDLHRGLRRSRWTRRRVRHDQFEEGGASWPTSPTANWPMSGRPAGAASFRRRYTDKIVVSGYFWEGAAAAGTPAPRPQEEKRPIRDPLRRPGAVVTGAGPSGRPNRVGIGRPGRQSRGQRSGWGPGRVRGRVRRAGRPGGGRDPGRGGEAVATTIPSLTPQGAKPSSTRGFGRVDILITMREGGSCETKFLLKMTPEELGKKSCP